ncbi:transcriptional repressor LexA [bacterium]|nr:transcriptional repressor LexA [bacterium]
MSKPLTAKQGAILDFIRAQHARRGFPPTIREIGGHFGLRSTASVHDHLNALERKGHIVRRPHLSRGIALTSTSSKRTAPKATRPRPAIPLLGDIAAGTPILATENHDDLLPVDPELFGGGELFALRVRGDSMINAGIYDGDYALVHRQTTAENGEIVAVLIDDDATVKRLFREKRRVRLQPENDALDPIYLAPRQADVSILGKVVGVIRRL